MSSQHVHTAPEFDRIKAMQEALQMVLTEVCGPTKPYSHDSYLPPAMVEIIKKSLEETKR